MKPFLFLIFFAPISLLAQHFGTTRMEVKALPGLPAKDRAVEHFMNSFTETSSLTSYQKEWFYWTNYSRSNPKRFWDSIVAPLIKVYPEFQNSYSVSLKKDLFSTAPLPLLKPDTALLSIAQDQANSLASKNASPSHTSPNGNTFQSRVQKANIKSCAGENISFGPPNAVLGLVLLYLDQGVPDHGHRLSLLSRSYTEMGIGISAYPNDMFMVVQDFSCSQNP